MLGDSIGDTIGYSGGVLNSEAMVLTRVRTETTPLLDRFGEGFGRLRSPVPAGLSTPPPSRPVPNHVVSFNIDDETPTKGEIEAEVRQLRSNRAGVLTRLRSEHLPSWIREVYPAETSTIFPNPT